MSAYLRHVQGCDDGKGGTDSRSNSPRCHVPHQVHDKETHLHHYAYKKKKLLVHDTLLDRQMWKCIFITFTDMVLNTLLTVTANIDLTEIRIGCPKIQVR